MKLYEAVHQYEFHDSLLEAIEYDPQKRTVRLTVDFCFWMQDSYDGTQPETGMLCFKFTGVARLEYEPYHVNSDVILSVDSDGKDEITFCVFSEDSGDCRTITISAADVEAEPCR